jgi:DNA topoisomerase I
MSQEQVGQGQICECGSTMHVKWGRNGDFLECDTRPKCKLTQTIGGEKGFGETDEVCICGSPMMVRMSMYGKFLGCPTYPDCRHVLPYYIGIDCQECDGRLCERRTRYGKTYYACSNYPTCRYAVWDKPVLKTCESCQEPITYERAKTVVVGRYCRECKHEEEGHPEGPGVTVPEAA